MTTAKLNTQHDYITLTVRFEGKTRINLTTARYSEKCSATGIDGETMKRVFNAFHKSRAHVTKGGKFSTMGEWMDHMRALAEKATDPSNLADIFATMIPSAAEAKMAKDEEDKAMKALDEVIAAGKKAVPVPTPALLIEEAPPTAKEMGKFNWSQEELQAAFDKVKNSKDWKVRIDRTILKADLNVTMAAIAHFHGAMPYEVAHSNPLKVTIRSKGYAC